MQFIDLFAGCGGLSLGLMQSGWEGLFGIEKSEDAFETLSHNLIEGDRYKFKWPTWLQQNCMDINDFIRSNKEHLLRLQGRVDLIAGGPPCQGYSLIGRRDPNDPRNQLFKAYIEVVKLIEPRFLLFENVQSITFGFKSTNKNKKIKPKEPYSNIITTELEKIGYKVFSKVIKSSDVGIPQRRNRFVLIAIHNNDPVLSKIRNNSPFDIFQFLLPTFRVSKGLCKRRNTTVKMAIYDLKTEGSNLIACTDAKKSGALQIEYKPPAKLNSYLSLMRRGMNGETPNSLRLANHLSKTRRKFLEILNTCEPGRNLTLKDRNRLGIRKHAIIPLAPNQLSATVTTLPDDMLHYSEPRILTVRELARLQSFPDWFAFMGRYTTGNKYRKFECPRYTQVGNAVPPLLAEALGNTLFYIANMADTNDQ